ncbi:Inositol 2-dehydrogenase/D-chiro-inositol 3-dehydrogenase [bioreactor metagenome]|uniref:Inositol 2-dehydrogenase/D-chiro-inositol 3-dehydrogenase n=1 Tax=bioreactor metagenome TaxID=1076179 RepID=A0A644V140_9ZZZZ
MTTSIAESAARRPVFTSGAGLLGVGVIGAGVMGGFHARLFGAGIGGARLAAVSDPDRGRAAAVAAGAAVFEDGLALIRDDAVDAVLVAAPDAAHHGLVIEALRLGKPVLCEKPLAATLPECREIVAAEGGRGLVSTGFMRRFDPAYREMKAALAAGQVGVPLLLNCAHRNQAAPGWFTGPMIVTNAMVHEIDIARWLLGAEYVEARIAEVGAQGDMVLAELVTDLGAVVRIEVFMNAAYGYHVQTELVGRAGSVTMAEPALTRLRSAGAARAAYPSDWIGRFAESYRAQDQAWVDGIRSGQPDAALASARDGLRATDYCLQLVEMLAAGGCGTLTPAA